MELGRREYGVLRCRKEDGCDKPAPTLDAVDTVAFEIFKRCLRERQWHKVGDPMTGYRRDRLDYDAVFRIADSMGFELTDQLRSRVADCQEWLLENDEKEITAARRKQAKPEELVN